MLPLCVSDLCLAIELNISDYLINTIYNLHTWFNLRHITNIIVIASKIDFQPMQAHLVI